MQIIIKVNLISFSSIRLSQLYVVSNGEFINKAYTRLYSTLKSTFLCVYLKTVIRTNC